MPDSYPSEYAEYFNDMGALELAKLRIDGFVSMDASSNGSIVSKPMELNGREIRINAEAPHGEIRVAVIDPATMTPVSGYTTSNCYPIRGDQVSAKVSWPAGPLTVQHPVKLHFELSNAKLYSFWLAS